MEIVIALLLSGYAFLAWRDPRLALFVLAASLPAYLLRFELGGIPFTALEAMIWLLALGWFLRRKEFPVDLAALRPWRLPLLVLLLAASVSVLVSPDTIAALGVWRAYYVKPTMLFLLAHALMRDAADRRRLFVALGASAAFVALVGIAQYLLDAGIPAPWDVERRVTSVYPFPNAVGLFLAPIAVAVAVLGYFSSGKPRMAWLVGAAISTVTILFAKTEAALVAMDATLGPAALAHRPTRKAAAVLGALGLLVIAVSPWRADLVEKLTLQDRSGEVRRAQWVETAAFLKDHPIEGAGLSGYPTAIAPYHSRTDLEIFQYPHTLVLNAWVETGLLGLLALCWLAIVAFRHSPAPSRWREHPEEAAAALALLAMCIHGLVDVPFYKNDLAALTALLLAVLAHARRYA